MVGLQPLSAVECAPRLAQLIICILISIVVARPDSRVPQIMHRDRFSAPLVFMPGALCPIIWRGMAAVPHSLLVSYEP